MNKNKHLVFDERYVIEHSLNKNMSFKAIGKQILRNCREIICIFLESMLIYVMNEFSDSGGHFHGT